MMKECFLSFFLFLLGCSMALCGAFVLDGAEVFQLNGERSV